jgi:hypothetical protein
VVYRFGVFEFDGESGELRKNGRAVALEPQPAKALALLLSKGGEIASREELRDAVWGTDTHVDFDRGGNVIRPRLAGRDAPAQGLGGRAERRHHPLSPVLGLHRAHRRPLTQLLDGRDLSHVFARCPLSAVPAGTWKPEAGSRKPEAV